MPVCPVCGAVYGPGRFRCAKDGAALEEPSRPGAAAADRASVTVPAAADPAPAVGPAPPAPTGALEGQIVDGRYRILERLGMGGIGAVYRAERLKVGRVVAIKFLLPAIAADEAFVRRFEREAVAMSRLYHVHCVDLLDFGIHRGAPYLVIEYIPGRTLASVLETERLHPSRAVAIARQLLDALGYFHRLGIVHRDLKPENVMLLESAASGDFVKILDFGMVKFLGDEGGSADLSMRGIVVGTPSAMSPEQIRELPIDGRADLYAVGVLLYQLVVGKKPFWSEDPRRLIEMHLTRAPVPPRQILGPEALSEELERVILRALAKDRDERFPTAEAMSAALEAVPEGAGPRFLAPPIDEDALRPRRTWRSVLLVAAGLAALLAATGWVVARHGWIPGWRSWPSGGAGGGAAADAVVAWPDAAPRPGDASPPDASPPDARPPDALPSDAWPSDAWPSDAWPSGAWIGDADAGAGDGGAAGAEPVPVAGDAPLDATPAEAPVADPAAARDGAGA